MPWQCPQESGIKSYTLWGNRLHLTSPANSLSKQQQDNGGKSGDSDVVSTVAAYIKGSVFNKK